MVTDTSVHCGAQKQGLFPRLEATDHVISFGAILVALEEQHSCSSAVDSEE